MVHFGRRRVCAKKTDGRQLPCLSFCDDVSHGRASLPAQLQDASNCQDNDDESADEHADRGQSAFAGETGFAHPGTEPNSLGSPAIATEFVRLKVDVIVTHGPAVATLKQATSVIPIVLRGCARPGRRRPRRKSGAAGRLRKGLSPPLSARPPPAEACLG
jgi:hypothetical protein